MNRTNIVFSREVELKKKRHIFTKQEQSHKHGKQTYGLLKEGVNWEIGIYIYIYTLLYIKQTTNKDLMYNTGNSIQYSAMAYMGKQSKKEQMCVYVLMTHFAIYQKLT